MRGRSTSKAPKPRELDPENIDPRSALNCLLRSGSIFWRILSSEWAILDQIDQLRSMRITKSRTDDVRDMWLAALVVNAVLEFTDAVREVESKMRDETQTVLSVTAVLEEFIRTFEDLLSINTHRAARTFLTRPESCEPVVKRLVAAGSYLDGAGFRNAYWNRELDRFGVFSNMLWTVTCSIPRAVSPSPPPPPYTLHAFNIQHPDLEFDAPIPNQLLLEDATRGWKRKRTHSPDIEHVRKQRLLRFNAQPKAEIIEYVRRQRLLRFETEQEVAVVEEILE